MVKEKTKNQPSSVKIREQLDAKNKELEFKDDLFGMTLLTNPGLISSSRNIMFTSHLRQIVNLRNPEVPKMFTNYEDEVGKGSTSYTKSKENFIVHKRVLHYPIVPHTGQQYSLFLYDEENDTYDLTHKKMLEDLTEKYGYEYNNDFIDSKEEGSEINKGDVISKSSSYGDNMEYRYGLNARFMYSIDNRTIEDAIVVSKSFAERAVSKEVETFRVSVNDNDIFCNLYGTNANYKPFPDIGEEVIGSVVCALRRIHNSQLLHDLKQSNLRDVDYSSDACTFCDDGRISDITVYSNKLRSEIPDNQFNRQVLQYLDSQEMYYQEMLDTCEEIVASGSNFTKEIKFSIKKAREYLDNNVKWRNEDNSVFNNFIIEFTIERNVPLKIGQKITGRYGNKGVISTIVDDEFMPRLDNGKHIEIIFNSLGVINRLNSQQLFEQSINFICNRTVEHFQTIDSNSEKFDILYRLIQYFNETQATKLKEYYDTLLSEGKNGFFDDIQDSGIYIHIPPLWEKEPLFDRIKRLYKEFTFIKPYDLFVKKFGRDIKIMKPMYIGDMYILKLKQSSRNGFSARATGSISKKGIPEKSNTNNSHNEPYSKTPIRIGVQENTNAIIGVPSEIVARLHKFHRSSVEARQELGTRLSTTNGLIDELVDDKSYRNRNVDIMSAYLKTLGLKLSFETPEDDVIVDDGTLVSADYDGETLLGTQMEIREMVKRHNIKKEYDKNNVFVGSSEEYQARLNHRFEMKEVGDIIVDVNI